MHSARYFDIAFSRAEAEIALESLEKRLARGKRHKVRLLLSQEGKMEISSQAYNLVPSPQKIGITRYRVDSENPFFYHKTTRRDIYQKAYAEAEKRGWDEAILLNERGEVSEGTRTNIFALIDGVWMTPPVSSGLLAGIIRNKVLSENPDIIESVLYPADLRQAEKIHLTNAMMGRVAAVLV